MEICLSAIKILVAALQGRNNEEEGVAKSDDNRKVVKKIGSGRGRGRGRGGGIENNGNEGDIGGSEEFGSGDSVVKNKKPIRIKTVGFPIARFYLVQALLFTLIML